MFLWQIFCMWSAEDSKMINVVVAVWPKREIVGINYAQRFARCINITFTNGFTHFSSEECIEEGGGSLEVDTAKTNCRFIEKLNNLAFKPQLKRLRMTPQMNGSW